MAKHLLLPAVCSLAACALPPIDYDGEVFADHSDLEIVAVSTAPFEESDFTGVVRAATQDDLDSLVDDGAEHAPINVEEAFVVDGASIDGVEGPQPLLLSLHVVHAGGQREPLPMPAPGTSVAGTLRRGGWTGRLTVVVEDASGVVVAGSALTNERLDGAPATVDVQADPNGRVDATECGHRREQMLRITCNDAAVDEAKTLRVGEQVAACGLEFTNHATWAVESDWQCTDSVNPVIWSAFREP